MNENRLILSLFISGMLAISTILAGCAQNYSSPQQAADNACRALGPQALSGALIGGLGGAAAGAGIGALATGGSGKAAAIGAGIGLLAGVVAGMAEGHHLDQGDCAAAQLALQQYGSAPSGQPVVWNNPSTGSSGTYTPADSYTSTGGQICRPTDASYSIQGHAPVTGDQIIVCRTAAGDWEPQQQSPPSSSS